MIVKGAKIGLALSTRAAFASAVVLLGSVLGAAAVLGATLDDVRARGYLVCGVSEQTPGFAAANEHGHWSGLEVDFCGAVAAATLGRADAVKFRPLAAGERFQALKSGEVDVLGRATTWTLSRDTDLGLRFVGVLLHDGQGFLVRRAHAVTSVLELSGSSVCVLSGTNSEQGLVDFFTRRQMRYQRVVAERWEDLVKAYADGGCTLLTGDVSTLAFERSRLPTPNDHMLLPEFIAKEPLGPIVRQGDEQWFSIVRWTLFALIAAEELELTSANVESARTSSVVEIRRFLGVDANLGQAMGLENDWAFQIVKQVGNYGEVFDRNLGAKSLLKLDRGLNNIWTKDGLMFAPPVR